MSTAPIDFIASTPLDGMVDVLKLVVSYLTAVDCESLQASEHGESSKCSELSTLAREHVDHHARVISRAICRWWLMSKSSKFILKNMCTRPAAISQAVSPPGSSDACGGVGAYVGRLLLVSMRTYPRALRPSVMYFIYGQMIREVYSRRLSNVFKDMVHDMVYGDGLCNMSSDAVVFVAKSPGCNLSDLLDFVYLSNVFVLMHKDIMSCSRAVRWL